MDFGTVNTKLQAVLTGVRVGVEAGYKAPQIMSAFIDISGPQGPLATRIATAFARGTSFVTYGIPRAFIAIGKGLYKAYNYVVKMVGGLYSRVKSSAANISDSIKLAKQRGEKISWTVIKYIKNNVIKAGTKLMKSYGKATKKFGEQLVPKPKSNSPRAKAIYAVQKKIAVTGVRVALPLAAYGIAEAIN